MGKFALAKEATNKIQNKQKQGLMRLMSTPTKTASVVRFDTNKIVRMLAKIGAPLVLMQLVLLIGSYPQHLVHNRDIDAIEYYAGKHEVTKAEWRHGLKGYPYDKDFDEETMDINTPLGFIHAFHVTMRVRLGGMSLHAPVCSSWGKLNRGTSKRSPLNVLGNIANLKVREANKMVSRTTLILWLQIALGVFILLEQPNGSLMDQHHRLKYLIDKCCIHHISFDMEEFGGPTKKPTWVYSQYEWITDLLMMKTHPRAPGEKRRPKKQVSINVDILTCLQACFDRSKNKQTTTKTKHTNIKNNKKQT